MLIREWMTKDVITVTPDTSMLKTSKLMKDNNIRRVPVMDGNRLVGIVSDRDIRAASPSKATTLDMHELYYLLSEVKVKDIMTSEPVTVFDTDAVDDAALIMENKGIGGLPVMNGAGELVGIITDHDIFRVLVDFCGAGKGGLPLVEKAQKGAPVFLFRHAEGVGKTRLQQGIPSAFLHQKYTPLFSSSSITSSPVRSTL